MTQQQDQGQPDQHDPDSPTGSQAPMTTIDHVARAAVTLVCLAAAGGTAWIVHSVTTDLRPAFPDTRAGSALWLTFAAVLWVSPALCVAIALWHWRHFRLTGPQAAPEGHPDLPVNTPTPNPETWPHPISEEQVEAIERHLRDYRDSSP